MPDNSGPGTYYQNQAADPPPTSDGGDWKPSAPPPWAVDARHVEKPAGAGWKFEPIKGDPFAQQQPQKPAAPSWKFEPIQGDPFAKQSQPQQSSSGWDAYPAVKPDAKPAASPWDAYPVVHEAAPDAGRLPPAKQDDGKYQSSLDANEPDDSAVSMGARMRAGQGAAPQAMTQAGADVNALLGAAVSGTGQAIKGAGQAYRSADVAGAREDLARQQGKEAPPVGPAGDLYAAPDPDAVAADRATIANRAAPTFGAQTGQALIDAGQRDFPVPQGNQGFQTKVAATIGGAGPALAASVAASPAGPVASLAAAAAVIYPQSYAQTYEEARAKGATHDAADNAASSNAALQTVITSIPYSRALQFVPAPLRDGFAKTAINLAQHGIEFGTASATSTLADNYVAQRTYDPKRPLLQGVQDAAETGTAAGMILPLGGSVARHASDIAAPPASDAFVAANQKLQDIASGKAFNPQAPAAPAAQPHPAENYAAQAAQAQARPTFDVQNAAAEKPAVPTDAQAAAGNYPLVHKNVGGLGIAIETGAGQTRTGTAPDGTPWAVKMPADYGYVKRTEGADGDPVDVFLNPGMSKQSLMRPVFVIDQMDPATGQFDEHKALMGFANQADAIDAYRASFSDGSGDSRIGGVARMPFDQFRVWARKGDTTKPLTPDTAAPAATPTPPRRPLEVDASQAMAPPEMREPDQVAAQARKAAANAQAATPPAPPSISTTPAEPLPADHPKANTSPFIMSRPEDLTLDPKRFQFKASDENGVTGALAGVSRWDANLANPITTYRDTDGKLYVVNGHQRTDLANRAQAAGQQGVQIPNRVLDAHDGWTPDQARVMGAYQNIAEGSGTALDAAKVLRKPIPMPDGSMLPPLPPRAALVQQAQGLARLSDEAFGAVVHGVVPEAFAAEVGRQIDDPAQQIAALQILHRAEPANAEQARLLVQDVKNSGFLNGTQEDMFGSQAFAQSLFPERAKVLGQALQNLRGNKRVFSAAVSGEDALTAAGNRLDTAANQRGQTENEQLIARLQQDATTKGPLSDALSAAAQRVANGANIRGVTGDFLVQARRIVRNGQNEVLEHGAAPERREQALDGAAPEASGLENQQDALFAARGDDNKAPIAGSAIEVREQLGRVMQDVMRYAGLPPEVGLRLVDRIEKSAHGIGSKADASYTHGLITFALDTAPEDVPGKLFHEITHALWDPKLGLLSPTERLALEAQAHRYLQTGSNRADIERLYGSRPDILTQEAIARLAERALANARSAPPILVRVARNLVNLVRGLGQALRGYGFTTADDVFRSIMRGRRASPEAAANLQGRVVGSPAAEGAPAQRQRSSAPAPTPQPDRTIPDEIAHIATRTPDTYFARREPALSDKAALERAGQGAMFDRSAVQAQAARDQQPGLISKAPQKPMDEGLFAPPADDEQARMFAIRDENQGGLGLPSGIQMVNGHPVKISGGPITEAEHEAIERAQAQGRLGLPAGPLMVKLDPAKLPDAPLPAPTKGVLRAAAEDVLHMAEHGAREVREAIFPMTSGTKDAQNIAFRFANAQRGIAFRYRKLDDMIAAQFSPAERTAMGKALDAQSVFEQTLRENLSKLPAADQAEHEQQARAAFDQGKTGLAGLSEKQRATVESLNAISKATWQRMAARGLVKPGDQGIPYYMPRSFVAVENGKARRFKANDRTQDLAGPQTGGDKRKSSGPSVNAMHSFGSNLSTRGPGERAHLTPEESTAAANAKFGGHAELVTDIRSLIVALVRNERSIAGKDFLNAIKQYGEAAHEPSVIEGGNPDASRYFTLADHPALWSWKPKLVQAEDGAWGTAKNLDGSPAFEQVPIHISRDFEGPLKAVLSERTPWIYRGAMQLKGAVMHSIMWSPLMHLSVEVGRALPAMPGKVLTGRVFIDGHRGLSDDAFMDKAIKDGLAPIAQSWSSDPASIADQNINPHGRNPVTRAIGGAKDAVARNMEKFGGQFAGDVIRDPHQALLWRNVLKLQVGIYKNAMDNFVSKGLPPDAASVAAAHIANRYAGALPPENLHRFANMAANLYFFSRSFTLGNLGVMKDAVNGAPSHVMAAIEAAGGDRKTVQNALQMKARRAVAMDVGLFYLANAVTQAAFHAAAGLGTLGLVGAVGAAYQDWQQKAALALRESESNPLALAGLLPQHWNEPGKQDRAYIGNDASGRGTYARPMVGKVGEEFFGWLTKPGAMLLQKENPLLSGIEDLIRGEDSLGRKVLAPDPRTLGDYLRNAGLAIGHLFGGIVPLQAMRDARDVFTSQHPGMATARLAGQATGLAQISTGYPGGPQAGVEHAAKERADFEWQQTGPAAHRLAEAGDYDGAVALIRESRLAPYDQNRMIASLGQQAGAGRSGMRNRREFQRSATDAEQDQFENVAGAP